MSPPVITHIGGNKTASTTLQRRLFSRHPHIRYLGEDCEGYAELKPLLDSLVADDNSFCDFSKVQRVFYERFDAGVGGGPCVFSNEDIMTSAMPSVCAARLKKLIPDTQIVMVIRNQLTTWPSWYINHGAYLKNVPRRYWRRHVTLDEWLEYCFNFPKQTPVEAMNYERFYTIFRGEFSASQIHVLLYEDLLTDPAAYYRQWADMLGIPNQEVLACMEDHVERRRYSTRRFFYDRWVSRLSVIPGLRNFQAEILRSFPALNGWLDSGTPAKIELSEIWGQRISDYYRQSNTRLAEMTGLDLARYGYPL